MAAAAYALELELGRSSSAIVCEGELCEIAKFRPLAVFYAEAIFVLNEIRIFVLRDCQAAVSHSFYVATRRAQMSIEISHRPDSAEMAKVLNSILIPRLSNHIEEIFS